MLVKETIDRNNFNLIKHGFKLVDIKPNNSKWRNVSVGDKIIYNKELKAKIVGLIYYSNPQELTNNENIDDIYPTFNEKEVRRYCYKYIPKCKDKGLYVLYLKVL